MLGLKIFTSRITDTPASRQWLLSLCLSARGVVNNSARA